MTENDSELIAVWISDRMHHGTPKPEALGQSIHEIDGVFTYLIADEGSIGFAKDRWAIKPLVAMGAMRPRSRWRPRSRRCGGSTGRKATSPTTTDPA